MKYNLDQYYNNDYYAKVGGVDLAELNSLEREFLTMIDYRLYVRKMEYERYKKAISSYVKLNRGTNVVRSVSKSI